MPRKIISLLLAILLLCSMGAAVSAHEVPDLSRPGTITITLRTEQGPVSGGSLTLYQVGLIHEDDGNYSFILTGDFASTGLSLEDPQSPELAAALAQHARDLPGGGITSPVGADGSVVFSVEPGLYLVVQDQPAPGYAPVNPFLTSVPNMENGVYIYEVNASPKVALTPETQPTEPTEPTVPTQPDPELPQTGQLNWPVPVLAVLGLCVFAAGWMLRYGGHREKDEDEIW